MKTTIGKSPLAAYLDKTNDAKTAEPKQHNAELVSAKKGTLKKESLFGVDDRQIKQRVTIHIPVYLIEKIKNAVYWEPSLTIAAFCEQALLKAIEKLEKEKGAAYPTRKEQLKGGRPIK